MAQSPHENDRKSILISASHHTLNDSITFNTKINKTNRKVQFITNSSNNMLKKYPYNKSLSNICPLMDEESLPSGPHLDTDTSSNYILEQQQPITPLNSMEQDISITTNKYNNNPQTLKLIPNNESIVVNQNRLSLIANNNNNIYHNQKPLPLMPNNESVKLNQHKLSQRRLPMQMNASINTTDSMSILYNHHSNNIQYNQVESKLNDNNDYDMQQNKQNKRYYRDPPLFSNVSYNNIPPLYPNNSHTLLPNTSSIQFTHDQVTNIVNKRKLSLEQHFNNDLRAFNTWMVCCDVEDDSFGYYSTLYPLLCDIFASDTNCVRVPKQSELEDVILKHGAVKMNISAAAHAPAPHVSSEMQHNFSMNSFDFDNPSISLQYYITIKYSFFPKFWKWFLESINIIKEFKHLWDILQCNLFCGRNECQRLLDQAPHGTFMLRLSSVISGGIVLSYCDGPQYRKNIQKQFKHTILIRKSKNKYMLRKSKSNSKTEKLTTINSVIRSFIKIKFLYTPKSLYPKKSIF